MTGTHEDIDDSELLDTDLEDDAIFEARFNEAIRELEFLGSEPCKSTLEIPPGGFKSDRDLLSAVFRQIIIDEGGVLPPPPTAKERAQQARMMRQIQEIRDDHYRPCVIAAMACDGLVGVFGSHDFPGDEFVQGGIESGESPYDAIKREITEELGIEFASGAFFLESDMTFLFETRLDMVMKPKDAITTSGGETVIPFGKHYLVYAVEIRGDWPPEIDFDEEWLRKSFDFQGGTIKFHRYSWSDAGHALRLTNAIQSGRKRKIVQRAIYSLMDLKLVRAN